MDFLHMEKTPRSNALKPYMNGDFDEITTDSGTGSRVFISRKKGRAVKLNEDRAYHTFAEHAKKNVCEHFPEISSHTVHQSDDQFNGYWFTLTEMEKLHTLSESEANGIIEWYAVVVSEDDGNELVDPFDLLETFQALQKLAIESNHNLDMGKATNYMARECDGKRVIVVIDPFN